MIRENKCTFRSYVKRVMGWSLLLIIFVYNFEIKSLIRSRVESEVVGFYIFSYI